MMRWPQPSLRPRRLRSARAGQPLPREAGRRPEVWLLKRRALVWSLLTLLCLILAGGGSYGVVLFKAEAVAVPSLVGYTLAEAGSRPDMGPVEAGGPSENSSEYEKGKIVRQQPQEGAESTEGQTVYVWLSAGPRWARPESGRDDRARGDRRGSLL